MTRRSRRWPITLPVCADFLPYFLPSRPEPTANDKPRQGGAIAQMGPPFCFHLPRLSVSILCCPCPISVAFPPPPPPSPPPLAVRIHPLLPMSDQRRIPSASRALRTGVELLSSMRFAISLLALICIASVIGTVLKQNEPAVNYVNQFGPFWAALFAALGLNAVYSAWWFLLILAFLVLSTSLCIARNTPKIFVDLRAYKENIRAQSLQAFHHKAQAELPEPAQAAARRMSTLLAGAGWKVRLQQRRRPRCKPGRKLRLDGGGQGRRREQARLPGRAQRHRAGVSGGAARWRTDRARPDAAGRQDAVPGRRPDRRCRA